MTEYRLAWVVEVDADSPQAAMRMARDIQLDPSSLATSFIVCPRCECGTFHADDAEELDMDDPESTHGRH